MSSIIDMSLEDIIKKKKGKNRKTIGDKVNKSIKVKPSKPMANISPKKLPITDARNKIISRKRTQITDAREKLTALAKQQDARTKLDLLRQKRIAQSKGNVILKSRMLQRKPANQRNSMKSMRLREPPVFLDPTRQISSRNTNLRHNILTHEKSSLKNRYIEKRVMGSRRLDHFQSLKPITRTVENDFITHLVDDDDDPMGDEDYSISSKSSSFANHKASLNLKIVTHNSDIRNRVGGSMSSRLSKIEKDPSPPRLPSILKKRPMAALRSERMSEPPVEQPKEFRIIVSNLRSSVTASDVQELFGDIGGMLESRLVRPGTAEVLYKSKEDAQKAVELYHNRQLDGQPMNCLLVVPRVGPLLAARSGSSKPSLPPSSSSNVEPDLSTFHKVLFSHF